jgi:hypothetical protein
VLPLGLELLVHVTKSAKMLQSSPAAASAYADAMTAPMLLQLGPVVTQNLREAAAGAVPAPDTRAAAWGTGVGSNSSSSSEAHYTLVAKWAYSVLVAVVLHGECQQPV